MVSKFKSLFLISALSVGSHALIMGSEKTMPSTPNSTSQSSINTISNSRQKALTKGWGWFYNRFNFGYRISSPSKIGTEQLNIAGIHKTPSEASSSNPVSSTESATLDKSKNTTNQSDSSSAKSSAPTKIDKVIFADIAIKSIEIDKEKVQKAARDIFLKNQPPPKPEKIDTGSGNEGFGWMLFSIGEIIREKRTGTNWFIEMKQKNEKNEQDWQDAVKKVEDNKKQEMADFIIKEAENARAHLEDEFNKALKRLTGQK